MRWSGKGSQSHTSKQIVEEADELQPITRAEAITAIATNLRKMRRSMLPLSTCAGHHANRAPSARCRSHHLVHDAQLPVLHVRHVQP